jgi:hypothetical protein
MAKKSDFSDDDQVIGQISDHIASVYKLTNKVFLKIGGSTVSVIPINVVNTIETVDSAVFKVSYYKLKKSEGIIIVFKKVRNI